MYLIQLRQVKQAIAAGDLDRAFELLQDEYLCQRKEARDMLKEMADIYLDRAGKAGDQGRYEDAVKFCQQAEKCMPGYEPAVELLADYQSQIRAKAGQDQQQAGKAAQVNEMLVKGQLTMAMNVLGESGLPGGELLRQQGELRRMQIDNIAGKLESALGDNDLDFCLELLHDVSQGERMGDSLSSLVRRVREMIFARLREDFTAGRLSRLAVVIEKSRAVISDSIEFAEWYDHVQQYQQARVNIEQGEYRKALQQLNRLKLSAPQASWLDGVVASLSRFADVHDELFSLLPEVEPVAAPSVYVSNTPVKNEPVKVGLARETEKATQIDIDGVGSFLVFTGDSVRIGPVSSVEKKDIAIIASPDSPLLEIYREEGDYFAKNIAGEIEVNGRKQREALLANGDKISVSNRSVAKFGRANPASETAVLDMTSVRMPQSDIKGVVLAGSEVILGSSSAAHIKCRGAKKDIVLKLNSRGGFSCEGEQVRAGSGIQKDGISLTIS